MDITLDKHMHQGGTHVTNFDKEQLAEYQEAVRVYEAVLVRRHYLKPVRLAVVDVPSVHAPRDYGGSLHCVDGATDLSDFWFVFDVLRLAKE